MLLNSTSLKALNTGLTATFNQAFEGAESCFQKITMVVPSNKASNTYAWLGTTTSFREWLGDRVIQNLQNHDYTIKNKDFENTIAVKVNDIKDDDIGIYTPIIQSLGRDAKLHPDELVFTLLKDGTTEKCYDGQPFFSASHPGVGSDRKKGTVSNFQSGDKPAWYLLDTSRPIKPIVFQEREKYELVAKDDIHDDNVFKRNEILYGVNTRVNVGFGLWQMAYASKADLTAENFEAAYANMCSVKGDNGKPLGVKPTILVVPPALRAKAHAIVTADKLANGQDNPNKNLVEVLDTAWLA